MPDLRHTLQWFAVFVWVYHIAWASRTFARLNERPAVFLPLLPLSWGYLTYKIFNTPLEGRMVIPGVLCLVGSLVLFEWARRSIRGKFFSWAYSKDTPQFLWTSGPYAYIRNPFYSSYMISYVGAVLLFPSIGTVVAAGALSAIFAMAAWSEEKKFGSSPLATEYEAYRRRTGRFVPRVI